jgi:hypothetical protein
MTRDEIMAMDGQSICTWLNERCVFPMNENIRQFYSDSPTCIKWNLPACAFAARDYVCKDNNCLWYVHLRGRGPLDWLRAAAIVIAEQEEVK